MIELDNKIEELLTEYRSLTNDLAKFKSTYDYLREKRKIILAKLMRNEEIDNNIIPVSKQERNALAKTEYLEILDEIRTNQNEEIIIFYKMKALEMEIGIWRTTQASNRMERNAYAL